MLILRAKTALNVAICMIFFNIFLDNGVMNTPKRQILSLVFTVLCFSVLSESFNEKVGAGAMVKGIVRVPCKPATGIRHTEDTLRFHSFLLFFISD